MGRTVVHHPENTTCVVVRRSCHHLLDQAVKGSDPILGLATAKDSGMMPVQSSEVGQGAASPILMFYAHARARAASMRRMLAPPRLNTGLLLCRNDEFIVFQGFTLPFPSIEIQQAPGFFRKVWIPRENPTAVIPRSNRILV